MSALTEDFYAWAGGIDPDEESIDVYIENAMMIDQDEDAARTELLQWAADGCPIDEEED